MLAENARQDAETKKQIVEDYNTKLNNRIEKYKTMIQEIEENNDKISQGGSWYIKYCVFVIGE